MAKWNINLSTTEPYNHIGLVKVRMDNNSEVFRATITENGKPYDFTTNGINKVYFNTKFQRFGTVQEEATIIDAANGIIEYTLTDNDMQQTTDTHHNHIQLAYFEFRKDDDYVASTQTFGYHIMSSIYKECTDGQSYIVRLEELFKLYQDFMNQQSQDWEEFVNANREILENIDPGGVILTELIDFRHSDMLDKTFDRIKDRGKFWDDSIRGIAILVEWFGAVGDGVTDDTEAIQKAVDYCAKNNLVATTSQNKTYMIKAHIDRSSVEEKMTFLHNAGGVLLPDNAWLHFAKNSRFKAITNSDYAYNIVRTYGGKNIKITGDGTLEGDGDSHTGDSGEFGHGLAIFGGEDIEVRGLKAINCWGDGFVTDVLDETKNEPVKNMSMFDCHADKNGRNGLSLQGNIGFYAQGCSFKGSYRTLPKAGVDVGPWIDSSKDVNSMQDIVFEECEISENVSNGLTSDGKYNEITLIRCKVHDNGKFDIETYETDSIKLKDCDLEGSKISFLNTNLIEFLRCNIVNTTIRNEDMNDFTGGYVYYKDCTYRTNSNSPIFININGNKNLVRLENVNANLNFDKLLSVVASKVELYNVSTINAATLMFGVTDSISIWGLNMHATKLVGGALVSGSNKKIAIMNAEVEATNHKYLAYEDSPGKTLTHLNVKDSNIECEVLYNKNLSGVFVELQRNSGGGFDSFDAMSGNFEKVPERSLRGIKTFTSYSNFTENSGKLKTGDLCIIFSEGKETPYRLYIFFSKDNIYEINTTKT